MAYLSKLDINKLVIEKVQLRHEQLIYYSQFEYINGSKQHQRHNLKQYISDKSTYSGEVTKHSQKRIRQSIHKLLLLSPSKTFFNTVTNKTETMTINFLTLTIPKGVHSKDSKRAYTLLLKPWLRIMKRKYHLNTYIWKVERQKNGSIHYHLTTNVFIPYYKIRDEWNNLLAKNEYLTEYNNRYKGKTPNSTDVHKVYKINDIAAYLTKYISKAEKGKLPIDGKVWGCSDDISKLKLPSVEVTDDIDVQLLELLSNNDLKEIDLEHSTLLKYNDSLKKKTKPIFIQSLIKTITDEHNKLKTIDKPTKKNKCNPAAIQ